LFGSTAIVNKWSYTNLHNGTGWHMKISS
jgi:hypothetical protein